MKIKIENVTKEKSIPIRGHIGCAEGESRQENKPALYIAVTTEDSGYEIHLYAETNEEFEKFVEDLKEIVANFPKDYKTKK